MRGKTTLVLGAGASLFMGYPTGAQLRKELISENLISFLSTEKKLASKKIVSEFMSVFKASQMNSIDAFLARRPEYSEIGKLAIAAVILLRERIHAILENDHEDNWYKYFFNRISSESESWDDLSFSKYSIVTFNYDRSFEHFMLTAISNSYGRSIAEAEQKLKEMKIVHVYGTIGAAYPSEAGYFEYESIVDAERIAVAASKLKVIPEGRQDEPTLEIARAELTESERIAFLGFGYDETNLIRLDTKRTCTRQKLTSSGVQIRTIAGTCVGMNAPEQQRACSLIGHREGQIKTINLFDLNCHQFLRETAMLYD